MRTSLQSASNVIATAILAHKIDRMCQLHMYVKCKQRVSGRLETNNAQNGRKLP